MLSRKEVKKVLEKYAGILHHIPGIVGVGIGGEEVNAYIVLFAEENTELLPRILASEIEGVKVKVEWSGHAKKFLEKIQKVLEWLPKNNILVQNAEQIRAYLIQYPDITYLVIPIATEIRAEFGDTAELMLQVCGREDYEHLTLYVREQEYGLDIMDRIERVVQPYDKEFTGKSGWLHVTTDFRPPLTQESPATN